MLSAACCMPVVRQKDIFFPFHAAHYSPEPLSTSTTRDNNEVLTVAPSNDIEKYRQTSTSQYREYGMYDNAWMHVVRSSQY